MRSSITSKFVLVALVTSMNRSGIGNDSVLATYNLTLEMTVNEVARKIHFLLHHPAMSLEVVVKTRLIHPKKFLVLLLGLGCPGFRWMFSDPDLLQII